MSTQVLSPSRPLKRPVLALLILVAAGALYFIQDKVLHYSSFNAVAYEDLWERRYGFLAHAFGGLVAITTGFVQLWLGLTGRIGRLHRALGKTYLAAVAVGSAGGFYLACTTVSPPTLDYRAGLFFLAAAWVLTTGMAYIAVRRRDFLQHREWMIRSYVVTCAFVTFRLSDKLFLWMGVQTGDSYDAMLAWTCWAVPLLVTEVLIQYRKIMPAR